MNKDDYFGFLSREPEPINFLSVEKSSDAEHETKGEAKFSVTFLLAGNKYIYERSVYTFFTLIGDVGGFNSAIVILPTFIMSIYSEHMY